MVPVEETKRTHNWKRPSISTLITSVGDLSASENPQHRDHPHPTLVTPNFIWDLVSFAILGSVNH